MADVQQHVDFAGNARFRIQRRLGEGSVGVVYLATDLETGRDVALKTLRKVEPLALFRFKQEFRALANVRHENIASLYELAVERDVWFFTMELVFGIDLLAYVATDLDPPIVDHALDRTLRCTAVVTIDVDEVATPREREEQRAQPKKKRCDHERLRDSLRQLTRGVLALHAAGKLHRDIKPSNVLVTPQHRAVLVDFGLVTELLPGGFELGGKRRVCGTAGYMSPEQSAANPLTPASDWYSVGTIVYEALTGTLPFVGTVDQVLRDKRSFEPVPARALVSDLPPDLDRLASDLLRLDPEHRPTGAEILSRLGGHAPLELIGRADPSAPIVASAGNFVGRARQLEQLDHALEAAAGGRTLVMVVSGSSGMGKTMLARKFLDELEKSERALVLAGRCYERESVPFKALDPILDALCHRLMMMDAQTLAAVLPDDAAAIARLFPVLDRVDAIASTAERARARASEARSERSERRWERGLRPSGTRDPVELLRRAVGSLRRLLASLSRLRPVVMFIDDLQWGDADSAALLAQLLEPPSSPSLLLITSHRAEDDDAPIIQRLRSIEVEVRELVLGALPEVESEALARELLEEPTMSGTAEENARSIAKESGGNPFFISELARYAKTKPKPTRKGLTFEAITLDEVLDGRFDRLAPIARRLLEVLAVAGRPIKQSVANRAAGLPPEDREPLDALRHQHLIRTRGSRADDLAETFHDRIRERAHSLLDRDELASTHLALAQALTSLDPDDAEGLALHFAGAGRIAEAALFAAKAAEQAFSILAFDRAAELFKDAIELLPGGPELHHHYARLGDSLANAGRGADAANAYLEGAKGSDLATTVELKRLAAEQLLRSGHVDEGLAVLDEVSATIGLTVPRSPKRAFASLLIRRARIAMRSTSFVERKASQIDPALLAKIDVCWTGALGLGMIDVIRSFDFQAAHFLSALDAGEPYRVARAFAGEGLTLATSGGRAAERARRMIEKAEEIALRIDHPHALGFCALTAGMSDNLAGRWASARRHYQRAEHFFFDRCAGATWEIATTQHMSFWALAYLGGLKELSREVPLRLREALRRGDLYAFTHLATGMSNLAWVVRNDVSGARAVLAEGMGRWSRRGFHLQHYNDLLAQVQLDLYQDQAEKAVRLLDARWPELERSLLLRVQQIRIEATHARARARLLAGDAAFVERAAHQIEREHMAWASPLATLLLAGKEDLLRRSENAISLYARAAQSLDRADMSAYACAARKRQGELTGGSEGEALVDSSVKWMVGQGIRDPARFAAMLVPHRSASR